MQQTVKELEEKLKLANDRIDELQRERTALEVRLMFLVSILLFVGF